MLICSIGCPNLVVRVVSFRDCLRNMGDSCHGCIGRRVSEGERRASERGTLPSGLWELLFIIMQFAFWQGCSLPLCCLFEEAGLKFHPDEYCCRARLNHLISRVSPSIFLRARLCVDLTNQDVVAHKKMGCCSCVRSSRLAFLEALVKLDSGQVLRGGQNTDSLVGSYSPP